MKTKYMLASLVNEQVILDVIQKVQSSIRQQTSDGDFIPNMSPHITFVPPLFATYEDVKKLCNTFNFLLSRAENVVFSISDLNWMKSGEDILHFPINTYSGFLTSIEQLRSYVDKNLGYVNPTPSERYYPHITIAKGIGLKEKTCKYLQDIQLTRIVGNFGVIKVFEKLPKGWMVVDVK